MIRADGEPPPEDEPVVLICQPVTWGGELIPGCKEYECDECEQKIWVAPTGQRILASREEARAVCVPCGQEIMTEQGVQPETPTDEQIKELKDALLRDKL